MNTQTFTPDDGAADASVAIEPIADLKTNIKDAYDEVSGALTGSECIDCGRRVFPKANSCYRCRSVALEPYTLPAEGTLYSYTWVHPGREKPPYCIGYVDLADDVRLLAPIAGPREHIACDVSVHIRPDGEGSWVFTAGQTAEEQSNSTEGGFNV